MELRKLDKNEHGQTRTLWKRVFSEDSKAFLDYYYFFKTRDNEIYVIEEDGGIRSMLHLNPYTIKIGCEQFTGHYIIAVATEEAYRRRGYMGKILRKSIQDMYDRKELFTFLMPAAESIYTPYDFRYVYDQNVWMYTIENVRSDPESFETKPAGYQMREPVVKALERQKTDLCVTEAEIGDGALLADFFHAYFSEKFQVCVLRDENYYQTMIFEQKSENGGIRLLKNGDKVVGAFLYGDEEGLEIREPLYLREYETDFWNAVRNLCTERGQNQAAVYAGTGEGEDWMQKTEKPVIMARIIHLESLLNALKVKEGEEMNCSFAVMDSILPQNSRVWRLQSKCLANVETVVENETDDVSGDLLVRETEDSEGVLSIAALTSLIFGYKSVEEVAEEPDVYLTQHLLDELKKIETFHAVYLNEIV